MAFLNAPYMPADFGRPAPSWQDRLGGLLSGDDAVFNAGIGILSNNTDGTFGGAVGRGLAQGAQQTQQAKQFKMQQSQQLAQRKQWERQERESQAQEQAHLDFDSKFPQYKGLSRISPAASMKIAYPSASANSADPYFKDVYDSKRGAGSFDARTGVYNWAEGGNPIIRPQDDPNLQGQISGSKSFNQNLYEPTNMQDGVIKNKSQLSIDTGAPPPYNAAPPQMPPPFQMNPSLLQTPKRTLPNMQIEPQVQAQRDDVRRQILLAEQQAEGGAGKNSYLDKEIAGMGGGIQVKTKAQSAGEEAQAKLEAELRMKPQIEVATATATAETKSAQSAKKGTVTLNSMMRYLYKDGKAERDESNRLTPPKDAMLLGNSVPDRALMKSHEYGFSNKKASNVIGVRRLINSLVLDANNGSLGAGVSNSDVEFLQKIQGVINSAQAPEDIYNAIADNEDRFNRILGAKEATEKPIIAKDAKIPATASANVVKIKGDADYNALPSGSAFIDPFGKKRIKP